LNLLNLLKEEHIPHIVHHLEVFELVKVERVGIWGILVRWQRAFGRAAGRRREEVSSSQGVVLVRQERDLT
jgi:hypothetical protein